MQKHELINLINGEDYSENLYRLIKRHAPDFCNLFVAFARTSCIDGSDLGDFDPSKSQAGQLYIGYGGLLDGDGYLFGWRLSSAICNGSKTKSFAHPPSHNFQVVENWWKDYIDLGKCFIDPEHFIYADKERWILSEDEKTRHCRWCSKFDQRRKEYTVVKHRWVSD